MSTLPLEPAHAPRRTHLLNSALGRLVFSTAIGIVAALAFPWGASLELRAVTGWCMGGSLLLGMAWLRMIQADVTQTRRRCVEEDPGRFLVWVVVVVACAFSLFTAVGLMQHALGSKHAQLLVGLCLWAVACAWCLTHTAFTLRYAHLFYRDDGDGEGGLEFPGGASPDDLDFAYFAFTIGTCFQTSDVSISNRIIRRTVLLHSVISFAFNTAIVALALNIAFSHIG